MGQGFMLVGGIVRTWAHFIYFCAILIRAAVAVSIAFLIEGCSCEPLLAAFKDVCIWDVHAFPPASIISTFFASCDDMRSIHLPTVWPSGKHVSKWVRYLLRQSTALFFAWSGVVSSVFFLQHL